MPSLLEQRRADTQERLDALRARLTRSSGLAAGKACVYATGSFGRSEASPCSDLDLFIVGRSNGKERILSRLDEICIKAELIDATRSSGIPDFSGDGLYLQPYTVHDLVQTLGKPNDDSENTFTARLLLLLESRALVGPEVYAEAVDQVLAKYWVEYREHETDFIPAFLANDILRLWRTFCVNYEAGTEREPEEKKAKRKLKNYKLKHSRLLTCYSGIAFLLAIFVEYGTVRPLDAREMVRMSPTERLEWLGKKERFAGCRDTVAELLERYSRFLENTGGAESELISKFMDRDASRAFSIDVGAFGDLIWRLLREVGDENPFFRMLVV